MEDIEWYTTIALPWAQTDQVNVTWNEWHFDNHLADRVPHEGVSRLVTTSKRQFKQHIVRRGLAFIMGKSYRALHSLFSFLLTHACHRGRLRRHCRG